jgi:hypothetical protein
MGDTDFRNEEKSMSRRTLLSALLAAAVAGTVGVVASEDAEAQERQFTGVRHEPRVQRPRSHTRGSRRHRRVARVHHRGKARPHPEPAPAQ